MSIPAADDSNASLSLRGWGLLLCLLAAWGCASGPRHYEAGMKLLGNEKYDQAIAEFTLAIEGRDHVAFAYISRADAHMAKESFEKAIDDYTAAIRLLPNSFWSYGRRAKAQLNLGKPEEFQADWAKAQELEHEAKGHGFIFRESTDEVTFADLSGDTGTATAQAAGDGDEDQGAEEGQAGASTVANADDAATPGAGLPTDATTGDATATRPSASANASPLTADDALMGLRLPTLELQPEELGSPQGAGTTPGANTAAGAQGTPDLPWFESFPPPFAAVCGAFVPLRGRLPRAGTLRLGGQVLDVGSDGCFAGLLFLPRLGWNLIDVDWIGEAAEPRRITLAYYRLR